jgi:hypothetical protein
MSSVTKYKAKHDFEVLSKLFLKEDFIYISGSIYMMNGVFSYARKVFDENKNYMGLISDKHYYDKIKYHLEDV